MVMWSGIQNITTAHYKEYQLPKTAKLCIDHNVWLEDNPIWRICVLLRNIQTDLLTTQYIYKIWQQNNSTDSCLLACDEGSSQQTTGSYCLHLLRWTVRKEGFLESLTL